MEASTLLQESYEKYTKMIKDSHDRRVTFINDLAEAKAKAGKINVVNALKALDDIIALI